MSGQNLGHKAKSSQVLEKPCVRSRGHTFDPIIMKLDQNVCLDRISNEFESGSCRFKNYVTRSNVRKSCVRSRGHIFCPIIMKLLENVCLDEISNEFENRSCRVQN